MRTPRNSHRLESVQKVTCSDLLLFLFLCMRIQAALVLENIKEIKRCVKYVSRLLTFGEVKSFKERCSCLWIYLWLCASRLCLSFPVISPLVFGFLLVDPRVHPPVHVCLVLRSQNEIQVDLLMVLDLTCTIKTRSRSAKLPKLCTLHASLTSSVCAFKARISSLDPGKERKMWGDTDGGGDANAQHEMCCCPTESKLLVPVAQHC